MILLSFDTEEFDVPREHGVDYTLQEGMAVSKVGTNRILDVLKENGVKPLSSVRVILPRTPQRSCSASWTKATRWPVMV